MIKNTKLALLLPVAMAIVGCSSSDPRFDPVEAPDVDNVFRVDELWSTGTGGVDNFFSELSPAFDAVNVYTASRDGTVVSLNQESGKENWVSNLAAQPENTNKRDARLSGGVALNGNSLAIGSENGYIYVLNSGDGLVRWSKYLEAEVVAKPTFNSSGTKLFVLDSRGNFTAFDAQSGEKLWVTGDAPQALRLRAQSTPVAVGDEYIVVGTSNGTVKVMLQSTGVTVNEIQVGQPVGTNALERLADVSSTPLILGHIMYAASFAGGLVEYDFGTFNYLSRLGYQSSRDFGFDHQSLLITSDDGTVYCLNLADNSQRWANTQLSNRNVTAPVVFGKYAMVGDFEGYMYLLDMADGSIDYMERVDSSGLYQAGQVKNGKLFVQARDGSLVAYSYMDGDKIAAAKQVENYNTQVLANAGAGLTLNHPGIYDGGIYAPSGMTAEQLEARRTAIRKAVAQQEAQIAAQRRAAEQARKARAEYEARRQAYEQEQIRRVSGYGIAPGVRSEVDQEQ